MHSIYYQSSQGEIVNLIEKPYKMLTETDMFDYEWQWETVGTNFPRITALKKQLVSPSFTIVVSGTSKQDMLDNVEHLTSVFDGDCYRGEMGRLYVGNYYRDCFITASTKSKIFQRNITSIEFVATSDNAEWKYEKEISFSGSGALVGEIADKVYVSASHQNQNIIYTPQADHTAHLEFPGWFVSDGSLWLKFDLGNVTNIGEFSGITVSRSATPVQFDLQISSGEVVDDTRTISATSRVPTDYILVDDFEKLVVDDTGLSTNVLMVIGLGTGYQEINRVLVEEGETVDVSAYRYIQFETQYASEGEPSTVTYTVSLEQWETIEQYDLNIGEEVEVVATDIECSSIRLKGSHFGTIDSDVSVVSDEQAPVRNLFSLGYQLDNLNVSINNGTYTFGIQDTTRDGYIYFDDTALVIKSIGCYGYVSDVKLQVQALINNEWENVTEISGTVWTGNVSANKVRVRAYTNGQSEGEYDAPFIRVTTDAKVYNESYAPSEAIIEISGMPNNPSIMIGNNEYGANIELQANHTLVIDTKNKTTMVYSEDGTAENVFDKRLPDTFERVERGENEVTWGGNTQIKITLEQARSEPKWN